MSTHRHFSRRQFITVSAAAMAASTLPLSAQEKVAEKPEPIIDIHQHTDYSGRNHDQLLAHQRAMGITTTIMLPSGRPIISASTHDGVSNGLQAGEYPIYSYAHDDRPPSVRKMADSFDQWLGECLNYFDSDE